MQNFEFQNPTKILFGKGQIENIKNEIPTGAKVLMLYGGGSIKSNGVYEQISSALEGYDWLEFGGIPANPEYKILLQALEVIKKDKIDYLLAVGGGSVLDGVKFLAGAAFYEGEPWDIPKDGVRPEKYMPFGAVLTLPATGSEMNSASVISREETKEKLGMSAPGFFPQFSVLDPQVVASIPKRQLVNGVVDAFNHVLEQYMTYPVQAHIQDRFAESILVTLTEIGPDVIKNPSDYDAAASFMWACTMALNGVIRVGVPTDWAIHAIGHELTALFGIDHARTLAIIGPNHYKHNLESKKAKLAQFGQRVWGLSEGTEEEIAKEAIQKTVDFYHSLEVKTKLSEYTDNFIDTANFIKERFNERGWTGIGEHKNVTPDDVAQIVEMSY